MPISYVITAEGGAAGSFIGEGDWLSEDARRLSSYYRQLIGTAHGTFSLPGLFFVTRSSA
jgi:hypothetical protein